MALIKCSECGKEISSQAVACPHCGYPLASASRDPATMSPQPTVPKAPLLQTQQLSKEASWWPPEKPPEKPSPKPNLANIALLSCGIIIILLVIAAAIGSFSPPQQSINPPQHSTSPPQHSEAWIDGHSTGRMIGRLDGSSSDPRVPTREELEDWANSQISSKFANASEAERKEWRSGFISGYESSFKAASEKAF